MVALSYVGKPATHGDDSTHGDELLNRASLLTALRSGVTQNWVQNQVSTAAGAKATIVDVTDAVADYATVSYATAAANALVPASALGAPATGSVPGVATLDNGGKIPLAQMPNLGAGFVLGPFAPTAVASGGSTTAAPLKIADINVGRQPWNFAPLCFAVVMVQSSLDGQPVAELRISDGSPASYAATTLIGQATGMTCWADAQPLTVTPTTGLNATPSSYSAYVPSYDTWISLWVYDRLNKTVSTGSSSVAACAAYLVRTS